jgi:hypothetical protein
MEEALEAEGYRVVNQGYPSTRASIAELAPHDDPARHGALRGGSGAFRDPFDGRHPRAAMAGDAPARRGWAGS